MQVWPLRPHAVTEFPATHEAPLRHPVHAAPSHAPPLHRDGAEQTLHAAPPEPHSSSDCCVPEGPAPVESQQPAQVDGEQVPASVEPASFPASSTPASFDPGF